jgi:hypothetical protein
MGQSRVCEAFRRTILLGWIGYSTNWAKKPKVSAKCSANTWKRRRYLVGLMPAEYAFSLKMAEEVLNRVSDHDLRKRIETFIHGS